MSWAISPRLSQASLAFPPPRRGDLSWLLLKAKGIVEKGLGEMATCSSKKLAGVDGTLASKGSLLEIASPTTSPLPPACHLPILRAACIFRALDPCPMLRIASELAWLAARLSFL